MQVILLEKIQKLGNLGDLSNVKAGYARNFLIPKNKVKPATKTNLAEFELIKSELQAKAAETLKNAQAVEAKMTGTVCIIQAHADEEGKLFGSINTANIQISLASSGFEIERRNINMSEAIRYTGEYEISVDLHTDITVNIKVAINAS